MKFAIALLGIVLGVHTAHAGLREVGNGGDPVEMEFKRIAIELYSRLSLSYPKNMKPVDLEAYFEKVKTASVEVGEHELLDHQGKLKSALNYRQSNRIEVNRNRWISDHDPRRKIALVFHEYLGLMGDDDLNYEISGALFSHPSLASLIVSTVEYDLTQDQPTLWKCYLAILGDFGALDSQRQNKEPKTLDQIGAILDEYLVEGFEVVNGDSRFQLRSVRYRTFPDDGLGFMRVLSQILVEEWNENRVYWDRKNVGNIDYSLITTLYRGYRQAGLPAGCIGIVKMDSKTGLITSIAP